jgi:hypothetical protein
VQDVIHHALVDRRSTAQAGHVRLGPRFIDKFQVSRLGASLTQLPDEAPVCDVGPVLLVGMDCL